MCSITERQDSPRCVLARLPSSSNNIHNLVVVIVVVVVVVVVVVGYAVMDPATVYADYF